MSQSEFVDSLLELRSEIEKYSISELKEIIGFDTIDERRLRFETMIFSLWLVTLSISEYNSEIKDLLHNKFAEKHWGVEGKENVLIEIDKRYKNYYESYNIWQGNPQNGHMIGSVMIEIIKNQNSNFSLDNEIPLVDGDEALKAFIIFNKMLSSSLEMIKEIKKRYRFNF